MAADNSNAFTDDSNWVTDSRGGVSFIPPSLKQASTGNIPVGTNDGVSKGVISYNSRTGEVEQRKVTSAYAGEGNAVPGNVMSTYRDHLGSATKAYRDTGTIQYGGMEISLKQAVEMNLVQRSANGGYEDVATTEGGTPSPKGAEAEDGTTSSVELFSPEAESTFAALVAPIAQGNYDSTMAAGTLAITSGEVTAEEVISQMASKLAHAEGGNAKDHAHAVSAAMTLFGSQVSMTLEAAGVPKVNHDDLYAFARSTEQGRRDLQQALTQLTAARNPSGFAALAEKFFQNASPSIARLQAEGLNVRRQPGGGFEVQREDGSFQPVSELRYERPSKR